MLSVGNNINNDFESSFTQILNRTKQNLDRINQKYAITNNNNFTTTSSNASQLSIQPMLLAQSTLQSQINAPESSEWKKRVESYENISSNDINKQNNYHSNPIYSNNSILNDIKNSNNDYSDIISKLTSRIDKLEAAQIKSNNFESSIESMNKNYDKIYNESKETHHILSQIQMKVSINGSQIEVLQTENDSKRNMLSRMDSWMRQFEIFRQDVDERIASLQQTIRIIEKDQSKHSIQSLLPDLATKADIDVARDRMAVISQQMIASSLAGVYEKLLTNINNNNGGNDLITTAFDKSLEKAEQNSLIQSKINEQLEVKAEQLRSDLRSYLQVQLEEKQQYQTSKSSLNANDEAVSLMRMKAATQSQDLLLSQSSLSNKIQQISDELYRIKDSLSLEQTNLAASLNNLDRRVEEFAIISNNTANQVISRSARLEDIVRDADIGLRNHTSNIKEELQSQIQSLSKEWESERVSLDRRLLINERISEDCVERLKLSQTMIDTHLIASPEFKKIQIMANDMQAVVVGQESLRAECRETANNVYKLQATTANKNDVLMIRENLNSLESISKEKLASLTALTNKLTDDSLAMTKKLLAAESSNNQHNTSIMAINSKLSNYEMDRESLSLLKNTSNIHNEDLKQVNAKYQSIEAQLTNEINSLKSLTGSLSSRMMTTEGKLTVSINTSTAENQSKSSQLSLLTQQTRNIEQNLQQLQSLIFQLQSNGNQSARNNDNHTSTAPVMTSSGMSVNTTSSSTIPSSSSNSNNSFKAEVESKIMTSAVSTQARAPSATVMKASEDVVYDEFTSPVVLSQVSLQGSKTATQAKNNAEYSSHIPPMKLSTTVSKGSVLVEEEEMPNSDVVTKAQPLSPVVMSLSNRPLPSIPVSNSQKQSSSTATAADTIAAALAAIQDDDDDDLNEVEEFSMLSSQTNSPDKKQVSYYEQNKAPASSSLFAVGYTRPNDKPSAAHTSRLEEEEDDEFDVAKEIPAKHDKDNSNSDNSFDESESDDDFHHSRDNNNNNNNNAKDGKRDKGSNDEFSQSVNSHDFRRDDHKQAGQDSDDDVSRGEAFSNVGTAALTKNKSSAVRGLVRDSDDEISDSVNSNQSSRNNPNNRSNYNHNNDSAPSQASQGPNYSHNRARDSDDELSQSINSNSNNVNAAKKEMSSKDSDEDKSRQSRDPFIGLSGIGGKGRKNSIDQYNNGGNMSHQSNDDNHEHIELTNDDHSIDSHDSSEPRVNNRNNNNNNHNDSYNNSNRDKVQSSHRNANDANESSVMSDSDWDESLNDISSINPSPVKTNTNNDYAIAQAKRPIIPVLSLPAVDTHTSPPNVKSHITTSNQSPSQSHPIPPIPIRDIVLNTATTTINNNDDNNDKNRNNYVINNNNNSNNNDSSSNTVINAGVISANPTPSNASLSIRDRLKLRQEALKNQKISKTNSIEDISAVPANANPRSPSSSSSTAISDIPVDIPHNDTTSHNNHNSAAFLEKDLPSSNNLTHAQLAPTKPSFNSSTITGINTNAIDVNDSDSMSSLQSHSQQNYSPPTSPQRILSTGTVKQAPLHHANNNKASSTSPLHANISKIRSFDSDDDEEDDDNVVIAFGEADSF
eukprot:gene4463-6311_t